MSSWPSGTASEGPAFCASTQRALGRQQASKSQSPAQAFSATKTSSLSQFSWLKPEAEHSAGVRAAGEAPSASSAACAAARAAHLHCWPALSAAS